MNEVVIIVGISSSMLTTVGTIVDVVAIEGIGNMVAIRLVIKETCIPNELSAYFELFFFLVC